MDRVIRALREEDVPEIERIYSLYWLDDDEFRQKLSEKLAGVVQRDQKILEQKFNYLVLEQDRSVAGVAGIRKCPEAMRTYAKTGNPCELYILAARDQGIGIGKELVERVVAEARGAGYSEIVLFSSESHGSSWGFYDYLGFERVGPTIAPDREPGQIWRMEV